MNESPASFSDLEPAAPAPSHITIRLPSTQPSVTYVILGLTILVYLLQTASQFLFGYDLPLRVQGW